MKLLHFTYSINIGDRLPNLSGGFEYLGNDQFEIIKEFYYQHQTEEFENFINSKELTDQDLTRWKNWIKELCWIKRKHMIKILKGSNNTIFVFLKN